MNAADGAACLGRGQTHQRAGRTVDALLCYREALAADSYAIQAHFHLGEVQRDLGRDGDAFDAWRTVLTLQPRHLPTLLAFGAAARRIGKTAESAEAFRRAIAFEPQNRQARYGFALTRLAAGDADAWAEIQQSIDDGIARDEPEELARLLLSAPDSPGKRSLIQELAKRGEPAAPAWLLAMAAEDAAARGDRERVLALLESAELAAPTASLQALRLLALAAAGVVPDSAWAARYAAQCMSLHAQEAPLVWPRRTAGAALRIAYLIAPGRPLRVGTVDMDADRYLRHVAAAHPSERIAAVVFDVGASPSPGSAPAGPARWAMTALGSAPAPGMAQRLAEADLDAIVDLAGMTAATGPLLAQRPARSVWTLDSLFAAHAAPLILSRLPAPRSASDDDLHAHRQEIEAAVVAAMAPQLSSGAACAVPAMLMARHWHEALRAHQSQNADAAIAAYRGVLDLQPDFARARYLLALLLRDRGDQIDAVAQLTLAVRAAPGCVDARAALANLLREAGRLDEAIALCRDGLAAAPRAAPLWRALGLAELARRQGNAARAAFDRALSLQPADAETHYNRGVALQVGRKRRAAHNAYRRALALQPDLTAAGYNSGVVLREMGRTDAAVDAFELVIAKDPVHVTAHNALCETLHESGRTDDWLRAFRRFEANCPDALPLAVQALEACQYQADFAALDGYLARLRGGAFKPSSDTELVDCLETLLFLILYFDIEAAEVLELYCQYAAAAPRVYGAAVMLAPRRRSGRIRIGYLSGDLRDHVMGKMIWEEVRRHDRRRFELYFYSLSAVSDAWTARYRALGDHFITLADATEREAAARIAADEIDLLVDLATNTRGAKPGILALRPAQVQITHVASAGVIGLRAIDFKLTDAFADLPESQRGQLETLLPIEGCVYPYRHIVPAAVHPYRRDWLGIDADAVVIAAFVNPMKLSRRCLALWRDVLERIPRAVLAISPLSSSAGEAQQRLFAAAGIARQRTIVLPAGRDEAENQARYAIVDLVLDPLPYGGVNGTLEALDMGVPVVTLCGRRHGERSSYSILANLGVLDTVAHHPADYVAIAARLAEDRAFSTQVKAAIRAGLAKSPLTDMDAHVRNVERAYLTALERRYPAALEGSA